MKRDLLLNSLITLILLPSFLQAQENFQRNPEYVEQVDTCVEGRTAEQIDVTDEARLRACTIWSEYEGEFPRAIYFRALLHKNMGDWEKAITDFSSIIDLGGASAHVFYSRSRLILQYRQDLESALADLSQAIVLSGDNPEEDYFFNRAFVLLRLATNSSAEAEYDLTNLRLSMLDLDQFLELTEQTEDGAVQLERNSVLEARERIENFVN